MSEITAVGVFADRRKALEAVEALHRAGFDGKAVGLVGRDGEEKTKSAEQLAADPQSTGDNAAAGAGVGAAAGAMTGLGAGLAVLTGLIPGVGPVIAGGALTLLLAGSGAAAGSLLGGLLGMGVPQDDAERYHSEVAAGRTLVTVHAGDRYGEALTILAQQGAAQRTIDAGPPS